MASLQSSMIFLVDLVLRSAGDVQLVGSIERLRAEGDVAEEAHEDEMVVGAKEVALGHKAGAQGGVHLRPGEFLQGEVGPEDAGIRAPDVRCGGVGCVGREVGQLDGLYAVRSAAGSNDALTGHHVGGPDAHIVELGPLEGLVGGVDERYGIVRGEGCAGAHGIIRGLVQEFLAGNRCNNHKQYCKKLSHSRLEF